MRVESLSVALRPRLSLEATDLGFALVRAQARSVWLTFAPVFGVVFLLACATVEIAPWLPIVVIWWLKPWLDCSLLFILSRAVFGQPTRFADLWRERASVWRGQWWRTLLRQRFSPWRAFTQPVHQLEGQRGKALRQRRQLLLRGRGGAAMAMQFVFANVESALYIGLLLTLLMFTPKNYRDSMFSWFWSGGAQEGYWALLTTSFSAAAVFVLEPFFVAAGLAMYLNRRVELEAWDIEQEFRHAF
jgi:hypothetical protein